MKKEYLKIRDDVDLKELEKFGFKFNKGEETNIHSAADRYEYRSDKAGSSISIYCDDYYLKLYRQEPYIFIHKRVLMQDGIEYDLFEIPSIIFDLVQAGLVEKVMEEE